MREISFTTTKGKQTSMDINILNEQLSRTVQMPHPKELLAINGCDADSSFSLTTLQASEVLNLLKRLPSRTSTGPDELSATLLKQLAPAIAENLTIILNSCIEQSIFPDQWKKANVAAI